MCNPVGAVRLGSRASRTWWRRTRHPDLLQLPL